MHKHRLTRGILPLLAVVLLTTGCTKENVAPGLRIYTEAMTSDHDSKIIMDPLIPSDAHWAAYSDYISVWYKGLDVNDAEMHYIWANDWQERECYVDFDPTSITEGDKYIAWAPQDFWSEPDTHTVEGVKIRNFTSTLEYKRNEGVFKLDFPSVGFGSKDSNTLTFQHLTGGMIFRLVNNTPDTLKLSSIKLHARRHGTGDTLYLWPTSNFDCVGWDVSRGRNGKVQINTHERYGGPNHNDDHCTYMTIFYGADDDEPAGMYWYLKPGDHLPVILPIPIVENADFRFCLQPAVFHYGMWDVDPDQDHWIYKVIPNVTIKRNQILHIPDLVVE